MEIYQPYLKSIARTLRKKMTESERLIWSMIRKKKLLGMQFYRQKPIEAYVVDFYCPQAKLIIEIDGKYHLKEEIQEQDQFRETYL